MSADESSFFQLLKPRTELTSRKKDGFGLTLQYKPNREQGVSVTLACTKRHPRDPTYSFETVPYMTMAVGYAAASGLHKRGVARSKVVKEKADIQGHKRKISTTID